MRLDLGVLITDRGWRVRARIVKISKTAGVQLDDGRKFKRIDGLTSPRPFLALGTAQMCFENCFAWHQELGIYFIDVVLAIILSYHNSL